MTLMILFQLSLSERSRVELQSLLDKLKAAVTGELLDLLLLDLDYTGSGSGLYWIRSSQPEE